VNFTLASFALFGSVDEPNSLIATTFFAPSAPTSTKKLSVSQIAVIVLKRFMLLESGLINIKLHNNYGKRCHFSDKIGL
jgi:hypothetical protein